MKKTAKCKKQLTPLLYKILNIPLLPFLFPLYLENNFPYELFTSSTGF
jgi:hypothetical protein